MKTHYLKTVQPYFERCWQSLKTFEVRKNDRDFQTGDTVYLEEYDAETTTYSGRKLRCTILYVLHEFPAIEKGFVVFSFRIEMIHKLIINKLKNMNDLNTNAPDEAQNPLVCEGIVEYYVRWRHIPMDLYMTPIYLISIDHTQVKAKPNASNYDLMKAVSKEFENMNISPDDISIESFEQLPFEC